MCLVPALSMDGQEALIQRMNEIDWFHSIPLKDVIITPGRDYSMSKLKQVCLPEDLSGKSVLDIGAWDGFFSFQAEKNGAERVLATDHYCWSGPGWGSNEDSNLLERYLTQKLKIWILMLWIYLQNLWVNLMLLCS